MSDALPDGVAPAYSLWGEPRDDVMLTSAFGRDQGVQLITDDSSITYFEDPQPEIVDARAKKCRAKNDTCEGWRITDSEYCAAHAGKFRRTSSEPMTVEPE